MQQRAYMPGLGIALGAGLGLLIAVLFFDDRIAVSTAIGAGIGLVIGAALAQLYGNRTSRSGTPPNSTMTRDPGRGREPEDKR